MYRHSLEIKISRRPRPEEVRFLGVEYEEERISVKGLVRRFSCLDTEMESGRRKRRIGMGKESPTRAAVWRLRKFWEKMSGTAWRIWRVWGSGCVMCNVWVIWWCIRCKKMGFKSKYLLHVKHLWIIVFYRLLFPRGSWEVHSLDKYLVFHGQSYYFHFHI